MARKAGGYFRGWPQLGRFGHGWLLIARMLGLLGSGAFSACSLDGLLKSNELPPNVTDPAITQTPTGARAAYNNALRKWQLALGPGNNGNTFPLQAGLLSDELEGVVKSNGGISSNPNPVSLRQLAESPTNALTTDEVFAGLNDVRQQARQAIGLLGDYLPEDPALRAHLYAIEGYAEVMLAELFCSGIPLSTVDYKGDYTLRPGSTTAEVFTHAVALFDTALTLAGDSVRILNLSRVGQARALLGLGNYAAAVAAVTAVPDSFRYTVRYAGIDSSRGIGWYNGSDATFWFAAGVANGEGANGLDYRASNDPRTQTTPLGNGFYYPTKYHTSGADTLVLASGIEARLIAAEDALHRGDPGWLDTLNHLRETAITPALPDTVDPGSDAARVSLLFRERAFWLFLTGHRQGDMRRLVRQYGRSAAQVYPVGSSPYGGDYGSYIDAPIPWNERTLNPSFSGCNSRD